MNLAEMSVVKSRPSVPYRANLLFNGLLQTVPGLFLLFSSQRCQSTEDCWFFVPQTHWLDIVLLFCSPV